MHRNAITLALSLVGVLMQAQPTLAQVDVDLTVTVPVAEPSGSGVRNLLFGSFPGPNGAVRTKNVAAAVEPESPSVQSGYFRVTEIAGAAGLDISIESPSALVMSVGGASMPLSYDSRHGSACAVDGAGGTCTLTSFTPSASTALRFCKTTQQNGTCRRNSIYLAGSELRVYHGGLLEVPADPPAGIYLAEITLFINSIY